VTTTTAPTTEAPVRIALQTVVATTTNIAVEWDAVMNRLRVEDPRTGATIVVYSNGEVYRVAPEAPRGHIVIPVGEQMPRIVEALVHAGVIRVVRKVYDGVFKNAVVTAEVLI
jgi:hypothetical protein